MAVAPSLSPCCDDTYFAYITNLLSVKGSPIWPGLSATRKQGTLSYDCLLSLALTQFGQQQNQPETRNRGMLLHSQSLNQLRMKLTSSFPDSFAELGLAITILYTYEMLSLTSLDGWVNHALGLSRLMEAQGPSLCTSEPWHSLLEANRFSIILASLAAHKTTMLSDTVWKTIPWLSRTNEKDSMQYLLDILADLPNVRCMIDRRHDLDEIRTTCLKMIEELQAWRKGWNMYPTHWIQVLADDDPTALASPCHGVYLVFQNHICANEASLFNAALIQTISFLRTAELQHNKAHILPSHLSQLMQNAARQISQSVRYHLDSAFQMMGIIFLLYPLRMAWIAFDKNASAEGRWVANVITKIMQSQQSWAVAGKTLEYQVDSGATGQNAPDL